MNIYSYMRNVSHLPFPMRKADRRIHSVIPRSEATWESVILKLQICGKRENFTFWKRIATPVCGLARNDRLFDNLKADRLDEPVRFSKKGVRKDQIQPSISRAA